MVRKLTFCCGLAAIIPHFSPKCELTVSSYVLEYYEYQVDLNWIFNNLGETI